MDYARHAENPLLDTLGDGCCGHNPVSLPFPNSALTQWPTLILNAIPSNGKTNVVSSKSSPSFFIPGLTLVTS